MARRDYLTGTINAYETLSKEYVESTWNASPKELTAFASLLPKGARVLDVGCAGGRDAKKFCELGLEVTGIDLVHSFLRQAKENAPEAEFLEMDARNLKFPENFFDAIWANAVLLHLQKKEVPSCLCGFNRVLKKSGLLHLRVKQGKGRRSVKDKLLGSRRVVARTFTFFQAQELKEELEASGFEVVEQWIASDDLGRKTKWIAIWARKAG